MVEKERLGIALGCVAQPGVPGAPAIVYMIPGDRMAGAHGAARVACLVKRRQNGEARTGGAAEIVPFVGTLPPGRQAPRREMSPVDHVDRRKLDRRVILEGRADQFVIPGPIVLGVS